MQLVVLYNGGGSGSGGDTGTCLLQVFVSGGDVTTMTAPFTLTLSDSSTNGSKSKAAFEAFCSTCTAASTALALHAQVTSLAEPVTATTDTISSGGTRRVMFEVASVGSVNIGGNVVYTANVLISGVSYDDVAYFFEDATASVPSTFAATLEDSAASTSLYALEASAFESQCFASSPTKGVFAPVETTPTGLGVAHDIGCALCPANTSALPNGLCPQTLSVLGSGASSGASSSSAVPVWAWIGIAVVVLLAVAALARGSSSTRRSSR
jgi:hypothetical protein